MTKKKKTDNPFGVLEALKARLVAEEQERKSPAKPAYRPPSKKKVPRDDAADVAEFHRLMSGVAPLEPRHERVPVSPTTLPRGPRERAAPEAAAREDEAVIDHLRTLVEAAPRFEVSDDGERVEGRRTDVPPPVMRKLRHGAMPIDARLDLHGLSLGDARLAVSTFLRDKRQRGERTVLLIHGKGEHAPGGVGVLRGEIAAWLSQGAASEHVTGFVTARDEDGGTGALYVLLRR